MNKQYYIYIIANKQNGTLYVGFTSNLVKRVWEHKNKIFDGFAKKYGVSNLVYYEVYNDPENAIKREKRLKLYLRQWKIDLIEKENPNRNDLYSQINGSFGQAEG